MMIDLEMLPVFGLLANSSMSRPMRVSDKEENFSQSRHREAKQSLLLVEVLCRI